MSQLNIIKITIAVCGTDCISDFTILETSSGIQKLIFYEQGDVLSETNVCENSHGSDESNNLFIQLF